MLTPSLRSVASITAGYSGGHPTGDLYIHTRTRVEKMEKLKFIGQSVQNILTFIIDKEYSADYRFLITFCLFFTIGILNFAAYYPTK